MQEALLQKLSPPGGGALLEVATVAARKDGELWEGAATAMGRGLYPIHMGVLDLLPRGHGALSFAQAVNLLGLTARVYERPWRVNSLSLMSGRPLPPQRERAVLSAMLGPLEGELWLDLAASSALYGRWLAPQLAPSGGHVVALDFSWPMLQEARRRIVAEGHANIGLVRGRGEQLPFATGTLDGVVCGGSLNEFGAAAGSVLQEVARALRPGGAGVFMHLLAQDHGAGRLAQKYIASPSGIRFDTRHESNALFEQAGLTVEATRDFGMVAFTKVRKVAP